MTSRTDAELRRLLAGPRPGEQSESFDVQVLDVRGDGAEDILRRAREVLAIVLAQPVEPWPDTERWRSLLPDWFVTACAPERTLEQSEQELAWRRSLPEAERAEASAAELWTLGNWISWFTPAKRFWTWWNGVITAPDRLRIEVEADDSIVPTGSLNWLLRVAGADTVVDED